MNIVLCMGLQTGEYGSFKNRIHLFITPVMQTIPDTYISTIYELRKNKDICRHV
jgi:hypothetical protein